MSTLEDASAIRIVADDKLVLPVNLVGIDYRVSPPKAALSMRTAINAKKADEDPEAMMNAILAWIRAAFNKKDAEAVIKRLDDPKDALDLQHISLLVEKVVEAQTNENPST